MALNPENVSVDNLNLRITQIIDLLTIRHSNITLVPYGNDDRPRLISDDELIVLGSNNLANIANRYNAIYNDGETVGNLNIYISMMYLDQLINKDRYHVEIGEVYVFITRRELGEFIALYIMEPVTYYSPKFTGVFLPDFREWKNIKGGDSD